MKSVYGLHITALAYWYRAKYNKLTLIFFDIFEDAHKHIFIKMVNVGRETALRRLTYTN